MKNEKLIKAVLRDMVKNQGADKIWSSANQLLLYLTEGKEGQGEVNPHFIEKYKEFNNESESDNRRI